MATPVTGKMFDVAERSLQSAVGFLDRLRKQRARQHKEIETFLLSLTPQADLHTLVFSWPKPNGELVETDQSAAASLGKHMTKILRLKEDELTVLEDRRLLRSDLTRKLNNLGIFGGPSANPISQAALAFSGSDRNELRPDKDSPLWTKGVLKYYSISDYTEKSSSQAIRRFQRSHKSLGVSPTLIPNLTWGIAEFGRERPRVKKSKDRWTLLITRMPNSFHPDSKGIEPALVLMIADGVHGEATEAFRLLFTKDHTDLLKEINERVGNSLVYQIPLIVHMNGDLKASRLELPGPRCPIHVWDGDDRGIRREVYADTKNRLRKIRDL